MGISQTSAQASLRPACQLSRDGSLINELYELERTDRPEAALPMYDRRVELLPWRADVWSERGDARAALGDHEGARADFERALTLLQGDGPLALADHAR